MKQAPKNMKEKEAMIKKQFQENVKVQEKQYKAFKNHVLEKTQKREQKTVIKRMKTERKRKMALLWEQYEKTISDLHQVNRFFHQVPTFVSFFSVSFSVFLFFHFLLTSSHPPTQRSNPHSEQFFSKICYPVQSVDPTQI